MMIAVTTAIASSIATQILIFDVVSFFSLKKKFSGRVLLSYLIELTKYMFCEICVIFVGRVFDKSD